MLGPHPHRGQSLAPPRRQGDTVEVLFNTAGASCRRFDGAVPLLSNLRRHGTIGAPALPFEKHTK